MCTVNNLRKWRDVKIVGNGLRGRNDSRFVVYRMELFGAYHSIACPFFSMQCNFNYVSYTFFTFFATVFI